MYLSRLILNPRSRRVQSELARPYELHRSVYSAYPAQLPDHERLLYRLETDDRGGRLVLLAQSQGPPDWAWTGRAPGYLLPGTEVEVKQFELSLGLGQVLAFRLRANPTVKKRSHQREGQDPPRHGIRLGLVREEDQRSWLERKGAQHGFRPLRVRIMPEGMQASHTSRAKDGRRLAHLAVRYEGLVQVSDSERLLRAVRSGIGSAKGLGFGLLSLALLPAT